MIKIKLKWELHILYQLASFWLRVIENYDSAGVKNEEISQFSCHKVQRQVTAGVVKAARQWHQGSTSFPSFCSMSSVSGPLWPSSLVAPRCLGWHWESLHTWKTELMLFLSAFKKSSSKPTPDLTFHKYATCPAWRILDWSSSTF